MSKHKNRLLGVILGSNSAAWLTGLLGRRTLPLPASPVCCQYLVGIGSHLHLPELSKYWNIYCRLIELSK